MKKHLILFTCIVCTYFANAQGVSDRKVPPAASVERVESISDLPEGARIIDVVPVQGSEVKKSGFNVQTVPATKTNVDIEKLKESLVDSKKEETPAGAAITYTRQNSIFFLPGQHKLTASAESYLEEVIKQYKSSKNAIITIEAFADGDTEADQGQKIARSRAEQVTAYLMQKGIPFSGMKITVSGNAVLENDCYPGVKCSDSQHQDNRRVDVIIRR
jgi:outer membrane protein OmpA-like peptidoglycan-associated protein